MNSLEWNLKEVLEHGICCFIWRLGHGVWVVKKERSVVMWMLNCRFRCFNRTDRSF